MRKKALVIYGIFLALSFLFFALFQFPDHQLHIYYCDVGQGDGIYIRMPNQADVVIDGGPDTKILSCLGKYLPFYDRTIDLIVLTHPQKDHLEGLIDVVKRYTILHFSSTPIGHTSKGYQELAATIQAKKIPVTYLKAGDKINFENAEFSVWWPETKWLEETFPETDMDAQLGIKKELQKLSTDKDLNLFSLYLNLKYGNFDAFFTGDGDSQVQELLERLDLLHSIPKDIDVLKVPHHGSKTGLNEKFLKHLSPKVSIISVGKNSYGHPANSILKLLQTYGTVLTTQEKKTIEVVTDGREVGIRY